MALSNWDTLALNEESQPIAGVFVSPLEVSVEIYKNWLYVRDAKAWEANGTFTNNVIMQVEEGDLRYKDVNVLAVRGPQNGVYCAVWTRDYRHPDKKLIAMVGIGCYGYEGGDFVGVTQSAKEFLTNWIEQNEWLPSEIKKSLNLTEARRFNQGDAYFAEKLGDNIIDVATKVGEAEPTIMSQMIDRLK